MLTSRARTRDAQPAARRLRSRAAFTGHLRPRYIAAAVHDPVLMLPEPERRTWLLGALADLLSSAPWRHFVAAPIVLPRPSHFPERWSPDVHAVRRLIRRLLRFSDLDLTAHVELFEGRPPQVDSLGLRLTGSSHHKGAAGLYFGTHAGVAHFGADAGMLDDPAGITATLAHEVAHAYRDHHDLTGQGTDLEEQLTDLTAVFLGFGVLTANASLRHRSGHDPDRLLVQQWSTQRLGYLSPQDLCLLLAAQVLVRGPGRADPREITSHLGANQAAYFRAALQWLADAKPDLAAELGLPPAATWPPPDNLAALCRPLADDDDIQAPAPGDPSAEDTAALRRVFRVWRRPRSERLLLVLVILGAAGLAAASVPRSPIGLALVAVLATLAVLATGHYRHPRCSAPACQSPLARDAAACPRCGAVIAGDLDFADQHLAAVQALRDR